MAEGARLFDRHCSSCHGKDGQGAELGPNLVEKPVLLDTREFIEVVREGRNRMPSSRLLIAPDQELHILAWLKTRVYKQAEH
jgi:mono/diheme cytochrome c family protein